MSLSVFGNYTQSYDTNNRESVPLRSNSAVASVTNSGSQKVYKFKCTYSATVSDTMKRRGWVEVDENGDDWDIFFCDMIQLRDVFSSSAKGLADNQKVAHFRNCFEISRKHLMVRNLKRLRYRLEKCFGKEEAEKCDFYPTTFVLPMEQRFFINEFRNNPGSLWIIKPAAGAQGRGIFIFQRLKDYFDWRSRFELPDNNNGGQQNPNTILATDKIHNSLETKLESILKLQALRPTSSPMPEPLLTIPPSKLGWSKDDITQDEFSSCNGNPKIQNTDANLTTKVNDITSGSSSKITTDSTEPDATTQSQGDSQKPDPVRPEIYVVQRYIVNPYLIGGRKFDIRFYVLVTSYNPLKAWVYRDGFARFSAGQFSLKSLQDIYVHLTNVAIQRTSENYNAEKGSKWSLRCLREYLTARNGREGVQSLMNQIDNIVIRTLQSAHQQILQDRHCFEVYGFDVLIDDNLRPWLLEVNASPAFTPSNEEDYQLKSALIDDTVHVLDLEGRLTGFEKRIGGYDLLWNDGPVYANVIDCCHSAGPEKGIKLNSFLGCINNRQVQLHQIFANAKFIRNIQRSHFGHNYPKPDTNTSEPGAVGNELKNTLGTSSIGNGINGQIKDDRFRLPGQPFLPNSHTFEGTGLYFPTPSQSNNSSKPTPRTKSQLSYNTDGFVVAGKALGPRNCSIASRRQLM